jgi:hypothetical protein
MHPTLLPGTILTFATDFASEGGTVLYRVPDWVSIEWQEALVQGNRGYAHLTLPVDSVSTQYAAIMNVLRIDQPRPYPVGGFDTYEYRITELDDTTGPVLTVTAQPFINEFGRTQIRTLAGGGVSKIVTVAQMTPTEILADIILPAMVTEGYSSVALGAVDPMARLTNTFTNVTPLAILSWLEQQTGFDAYVTRTSEASWTLNLSTIGAAASHPIAVVGRNVVALDRSILADDQFTTRVEVDGATRPGDTEPSRIGQASWNATLVSGSTYTLTDAVGGNGPIGAVNQVTGKTALITLDPAHYPLAISPSAIAVDSSRHVVWLAQSATGDLVWHDLTTGNVGTVTVTGTSSILSLSYASGVDTLYAACSDAAKIEIINPSTKASTGHITMASNPQRLDYFWPNGKMVSIYNGGFNDEIVDTATNTIDGTLASSAFAAAKAYTYHSATNRYFMEAAGFSELNVFNATTRALVSSAVSLSGKTPAQLCNDPAASSVLVITTDGNACTINPSTLAVSGFTALSLAGSPTPVFGVMPFTSAYAFIVAPSSLFPISRSSLVVSSTYGDITATAGTYTVEPWNAPRDFLCAKTDTGVRRLQLASTAMPFDPETISACDASAQTITIPSSGSGGPAYVPTGSRIQIRENATLDYTTRLTDPAALATYGPADASPTGAAYGLVNYWRGGRAADWRSDDTLRWLTVPLAASATNGVRGNRWRTADLTGLGGLSVTLAALYTVGDLTLSLTGLGAGRVLSVGDVISSVSAYPISAANIVYVRQRTVANGSGAATVPITPGFTLDIGSPATLYVYSPTFTVAATQASSCLLIPTTGSTSSTIVATAPVPVPQIVSDATAWVVAHVELWCIDLRPNNVFLKVSTPYSGGAFSTTTRPADTAAVQTGEVRDYWLAQRVDLTNPASGFITFQIGTDTAAGSGTRGSILLRSMAVILSPDSTVNLTLDVYGAEGANALWQLGNTRLAQGRSPTVTYRCQVVEDDPTAPFSLGATTLLRDSVRGISASPRVVSVTRYGTGPDEPLRQPTIELSNANVSLLRSVLALQEAA